MSKPSTKYLEKVDMWLLGGLPIRNMAMSTEQKFRARVAYEAYQVWLNSKQINATNVIRNIAAREYELLLAKAQEGSVEAERIVADLNIKDGIPRTPTEIANDVAVLNHIIECFSVDTESIERHKVLDASDWLIREGMKSGNDRSVTSGANIKMTLFDNFNAKEDASTQMPSTDINITGDVSVIKPGRKNLSEEELRKLRRKYNLTEKEVQDLESDEDGVYSVPDPLSEQSSMADDEEPLFDE